MKTADNKPFWQRFARLYGPVMEKSGRPLYEDICGRVRPALRPDMEVLELACGTGQLSFRLAGSVRLWQATDFSEAMIREARRRAAPGNLRFCVQDATALRCPPERYDVVVISNALHIMPHPEKALAEIHRVMKPGGLLFAPTFVHGEGRGFRLRVRLMELAGFHTYYKWSEAELAAYIAAHGFRVEEQAVLGGSLAPLCFIKAVKG